jgi:hypothetical protein
VTTQHREIPSTDWKEIRRRYEGERCSIRALAREHETTDTTIHRRAKLEGWKLYSAKSAQNSAPQRGVQQPQKTPMLWDFEPRRDALIEGLKRSRNGVDCVEDAIYADFPTVMALLWFQAPFAEIARALQIDEPRLEALYGPVILGFVRDSYSDRPKKAQRGVGANAWRRAR